MTEIQFWANHVKPALNVQFKDRVAWKVGTSTRAGIPDVGYRTGQQMAWIELKRIPFWPARKTTPITLGLSIEQRAHLHEWCHSSNGNGFVLLSIEKDVVLLPWWTPDRIEREQWDMVTLGQIELRRCGLDLGNLIDEYIFGTLERAIIREGVVTFLAL